MDVTSAAPPENEEHHLSPVHSPGAKRAAYPKTKPTGVVCESAPSCDQKVLPGAEATEKSVDHNKTDKKEKKADFTSSDPEARA